MSSRNRPGRLARGQLALRSATLLLTLSLGLPLRAEAQDAPSARPYRGLFGGTGSGTEHGQTLDVNWTTFAAYDDNVAADSAVSVDPTLALNGSVGTAGGQLRYKVRGERTSFGATFGSQGRYYPDFRDLLARKDIDAVMLALPDHWHSIIAVEAARHKKDLYGEKPLARTIAEQQAIVKAVQENKRIWQTGSWQRSQANFHKAAEIVRKGLI